MKVFTPEIQNAIQFAIEIHEINQRQKRKGEDEIPYISHLFIVALIVSLVTEKKEVIIAAILHDIVEDSENPRKVSLQEIEEKFGPRVRQLVAAVTETDKSLSWEVRKQMALEKIKTMDQDMMILKSADVLHNLSSLVADVKEKGIVVFDVFSAPQEKTLARYKKIIYELQRYWPENPLLNDLQTKYSELIALLK